MKETRVALHNLGCKVNEYEVERMAESLRNEGFLIVPFESFADIYIVNTCTVTNIADRKSRQMLHRAKKLNPNAVVVAAGCYVEVHDDIKTDPLIDIVLTNKEKLDVAKFIGKLRKDSAEEFIEDITKSNEEKVRPADETIIEHTRVFLKIQDGCDMFCSYCIIPYARGRVSSRDLCDILDEVKKHAKSGKREIVLTGIHISSYGKDTDEGINNGRTLLNVIKEVSQVPEIKRVRLGSLEPRIMSEEFIAELAKIPEICPQFHLSLQSGSDSVLKRMNRHYDTAEYEEICKDIRKYFPDAAITTDIIAGFPGETEEEHGQTLEFVKRINFARVHVFRYSKRQGTPAARAEGQIEEKVKARRAGEISKIADSLSEEYAKSFVGSKKEILIEERHEDADGVFYTGYTPEYVRAVIRNDGTEDLSGEIREFEIKSADGAELVAKSS